MVGSRRGDQHRPRRPAASVQQGRRRPVARDLERLRPKSLSYRDEIRIDSASLLVGSREEGESGAEFLGLDDASAQRLTCEIPVPLAVGGTVCEDEVVGLETQRDRPVVAIPASAVSGLEADVAPSLRAPSPFGDRRRARSSRRRGGTARRRRGLRRASRLSRGFPPGRDQPPSSGAASAAHRGTGQGSPGCRSRRTCLRRRRSRPRRSRAQTRPAARSAQLLEDLAALGFTKHPSERRVLAQIAGDLRVLAQDPANLGKRTVEERFPLIGIASVDLALVAPGPEYVARLVDHRAA